MKPVHLLALLSASLLAALPSPAFCSDDGGVADYSTDTATNANTQFVPLRGVLDSLALIAQAVDDLEASGGLSADGAQRFRLLLAGIVGQMNGIQVFWGQPDYSAGGGMGGPAEQTGPYYSQVVPSRQISLFSNPSAQDAQSAAAKEMSVWIDENGGAFVTGDDSAPDRVRMVILKQGWEKDYDTLQAQIQDMLAQFMAEHSAVPAANGEQPQPGEQI